jgi:hypothetical protein
VAAVPAVVGRELDGDVWAALAGAATSLGAAALVKRARLLGIAAAALPALPTDNPDSAPFTVDRGGSASPAPERPLVVDFSAMWAGPLCARVLGDAGARVVKVESSRRPDGARAGDPAFYDWLHAGHESAVLDFADAADLRQLHALVAQADVVVEGSRPRALRQLGIDAETVVGRRPGVTWVSITGHGRAGDAGELIAFGDDAAVAGGLVAYDAGGQPVFCGDAIADPLAGLYAAAAAAASVAAGGGRIVGIALADVAGDVAVTGRRVPPYNVREAGPDRWVVRAGGEEQPVLPPSPLAR